jgi:hypothetical protein
MIVTADYTAHQAANALLDQEIEPWVRETADRLVADKLATWVWDPSVPGVVGLVVDDDRPGGGRTALIVCYLADDDAEISETFHDLARTY